MSKQQLLRLSGVLFLLAGVAFLFSPVRWMAIVEVGLAAMMFALSVRAGRQT